MAEEAISPDTSVTTGVAQNIEPLSVNEAGDKLNALFAPEPKKKSVPDKDPTTGKFLKKDAPIPIPPADGSDDPDEELEPKDEAEETVEEEVEDEAPKPRTHKVKVDGMEVDVDEEELKKGYSRTSDYTRKTQELAAEKKRFEAEELSKYRSLIQEYEAKMAAVEEALTVLGPQQEPDWNTLRAQMSPEDFTAAFAEYRTHQQRFEKVRAERQRVMEQRESETARERQARLKQEMEKLQDALPDLRDAEKGKALKDDLSAYARSVGFTDDDLASVEDHRALVMLDKARRWDEYQKQKPKLEQKVDRALATAIKPTSPSPNRSGKAIDAAKTKFDKSKSLDDAADFLNHLLAPKKKAG